MCICVFVYVYICVFVFVFVHMRVCICLFDGLWLVGRTSWIWPAYEEGKRAWAGWQGKEWARNWAMEKAGKHLGNTGNNLYLGQSFEPLGVWNEQWTRIRANLHWMTRPPPQLHNHEKLPEKVHENFSEIRIQKSCGLWEAQVLWRECFWKSSFELKSVRVHGRCGWKWLYLGLYGVGAAT